ncbi:MAG: ATP phosphoribosyltransferase regulatory subunit [Ectothiorhodospiraceae bacterium AqS1]|nr:ATP phosphoribosyltransferase regulatory subunit [Ectothiorhodospiraceae bacterium AqS1]
MEELVPPHSLVLERLRRDLLDHFFRWGFDLVTPPFIEYLESLLTGAGEELDLHTFKLIDQLNGRMMGVRADMTPQVARIDARRLRRDRPTRLCYAGTVLHALPDGLSGTRSPFQAGAEIYGHAGIESDCEVICLMLEFLERLGIGGLHLCIGHVGIFRQLVKRAGLDAPREAALHGVLQRKARAEAKALLGQWGVDAKWERAIVALIDEAMVFDADSFGKGETGALASLAPLSDCGAAIESALFDLELLVRAIHARCPGVELQIDLADLRGYRYHTGTVFAAFVAGYGREVARGGRYDEIGGVFGRSRPATGFSMDLKTLVPLLADDVGDAFSKARTVQVPWSEDPSVHEAIAALRDKGERVLRCLPGESVEPGAYRLLRKSDGGWGIVDDPLDESGDAIERKGALESSFEAARGSRG